MTATARPRLQRASGESRVVFAVRDGETRLADLYQRDPCRVLFPEPEPGEPPQAVLVTTSGGVTDGDCLSMAIEVGPGATALAATQAAEKIYRAAQGGSDPCTMDIAVTRRRGRDARLAAAGDDRLRGRAAEAPHGRRRGAGRLAARPARWWSWAAPPRASASPRGLLLDSWSVRRGGKLAWTDTLRVEGETPTGAGFGTANALATVIGVWDEPQARFEKARALLEERRRGAGGRHAGQRRDGGAAAGRGDRRA